MRPHLALGAAIVLGTPAAAIAQSHEAHGIAKPHVALQQVVEGLPRDDKQSVRVMTASFRPGDKTVYHTHRYPVTVYVQEGAFTLELAGKPPLTIKAGEALVEPPGVPMTGYNRTERETKVVIFYVSAVDTPFLDLLAH